MIATNTFQNIYLLDSLLGKPHSIVQINLFLRCSQLAGNIPQRAWQGSHPFQWESKKRNSLYYGRK